MEIYLKKLTGDLLEVCRMLDDKPEIKTRLAEITADVSFLPDTGYALDKWTTTPPTEPGWYWATERHVALPKIVFARHVGTLDGGKGKPIFSIDEDGDIHSVFEYTHWLGPLPVPEPPKEGE